MLKVIQLRDFKYNKHKTEAYFILWQFALLHFSDVMFFSSFLFFFFFFFLKIYPTISDLRQLPHLRLHLPGPKNSPVYIQSLPEHCLKLKKIKKIFFKTKELLKNTQNTEPAHCIKTPRGASPNQKKKKRKENKKRSRKRAKE